MNSEREVKHLDQAELARFFAVIESPRDRLLFGLIYRLGLRCSEAATLPSSAVDVRRGTVAVQGLKHGLRRVYTLPADLRALAFAHVPGRERYFSGRQGALSRGRIWQLFKRYAEAAGLAPDLGPHSLRHSAAVHALDAGLTTEDVRDLLRHRRITTTEVYAQLSARRRDNYQARLEASGEIVRVGGAA